MTPQRGVSFSGHTTPALVCYVCMRLDKSFLMNLLHRSNRLLQNTKNIPFIQSVVLNFFCSTQVLANFTNFSKVFARLGSLFRVGCFGFFFLVTDMFLNIKKNAKHMNSSNENGRKKILLAMLYSDDIQGAVY